MLLDPPSALRLNLRPRLLSVGSGDSLEELDVRELETGSLASVTDPTLTTGQTAYWLDRSATDPVVAPDVIAATGGGRWFAFAPSGSGGSGDVATVNIVGRLANEGLRAVVGTPGKAVVVRGYDTAGDDGGDTFVWVTTPAPNNDGTVIVPGVAFGANTSGAHWKRVQTGPLNVRQFGAHGDYNPDANTGGVYDDVGIQRAMAALSLSPAISSKYTLLIPDGIYKVTTKIVVRSNYAILGVGRPILWGVGVSMVLELGIISPPDLIANADVLDITVLGGSGGGVAAVNAYATQACRVRVYVGGSWTYGVLSQLVAGAGGIAYSSIFEVYRFSYIASVNPFSVPAIVANLVWIEGAWTNTQLRVEGYQHSGYCVYYEQVNPGGLGTLFLSGMAQGTAQAVKFLGASTATIRDFYCEGNTADIDLEACYGVLVEKTVGRVKLTDCFGTSVDSTLQLDADKSNRGTTVRTSLSTDVTSASIITDQLGVIGYHVGREVAREGVWVSGLVPANDSNLFVNGDMRRWKTSGTTLLWGVSSWTTATTVKCGAGLADTTASNGSPFSARCSPTDGVGGGLPIKLCGPLGPAYENATITVSFKLRIATAGAGALIQLSDLTTVDWDLTLSSPTVVSPTGPAEEAIPVDNDFVLYHFSFSVTPEVAANGAQLVFLIYGGTEFYLSELQATVGPSAPHHFLGRGRAFNGSVEELVSGALQASGTAPPAGANEPYWNEPWLPGDIVLNSATSPGEPVMWVCQASGVTPVWAPVYAIATEPVPTALAVYPLTNADYGRTLVFTSGVPVSVTVPAGLQTGFSCTLVQQGAGQITVSGAAAINGRNGLKSAGQYAAVGIQNVAADSYVVGGDTTL